MSHQTILSMNHNAYAISIEDEILDAKIRTSFKDCLSDNDALNRHAHVIEVIGFNPYSLYVDRLPQATRLTQEQVVFELTRLFCLSLRNVSNYNRCSFHASTAVLDSGAICFSGVSGSGKTTLALLMSRYGRLMGDEYAVLDLTKGTVDHEPYPIQIKEGSKSLFPFIDYSSYAAVDNDAGLSSSLIPRSDMPALNKNENRAAPLKAIVFPRYNSDSVEAILQLAPLNQMPDLVLKSIANDNTPSQLLSRFARFVSERNVKLLTIDYSDGLDAISSLLDYLEE